MWIVAAMIACSNAEPPQPPPEPEPAVPTMHATVRIDAEPSGKRFQGVWLDREGEDPLIASYRADEVWLPFDGHAVEVTGEQWTPDPRAQQISAPHYRIATMSLQSPSADVPIHAVGPEQDYKGTIETLAGEPGTKMEGSTWTAVVSGGVSYQIWGTTGDLPQDTELTIVARTVEVSPFSAHMAGPTLWIAGTR